MSVVGTWLLLGYLANAIAVVLMGIPMLREQREEAPERVPTTTKGLLYVFVLPWVLAGLFLAIWLHVQWMAWQHLQPARNRWGFHCGPSRTGWWLYVLYWKPFTVKDAAAGGGSYGVAWGWDEEVPWAWLPTVYHQHKGEQIPEGILFTSFIWWSWLGFTVGQTSKSKWRLPNSGTGAAKQRRGKHG